MYKRLRERKSFIYVPLIEINLFMHKVKGRKLCSQVRGLVEELQMAVNLKGGHDNVDQPQANHEDTGKDFGSCWASKFSLTEYTEEPEK